MLILFGHNSDVEKLELFLSVVLDDRIERNNDNLQKLVEKAEKLNWQVKSIAMSALKERSAENLLRIADGLRSLGIRDKAYELYHRVLQDQKLLLKTFQWLNHVWRLMKSPKLRSIDL